MQYISYLRRILLCYRQYGQIEIFMLSYRLYGVLKVFKLSYRLYGELLFKAVLPAIRAERTIAMTNAKEQPLAIFTQRLAGYLMMNGFPLLGMRENKNGNNLNVFYFGNTPAIREQMAVYRERNRRRKETNSHGK